MLTLLTTLAYLLTTAIFGVIHWLRSWEGPGEKS